MTMLTGEIETDRKLSPQIIITTIGVEFTDPTATEGCPSPDYAYQVKSINITSQLVTRICAVAEHETHRVGCICGEKVVLPTGIRSFDIAHAVEHLIIVDLIDKKLVPSGGPLKAVARTGKFDNGIVFWIRKGLVSLEEEKTSLTNVLNKINSLLITGEYI
jgi:hypothetical protein